MSTAEKKQKYSFQEYLELEEKADYKSEFFNGEIFAMSGGTGNHSLIITNLTRDIGNALFDEDCFVFSSDLKVRIERADASAYPDLTVVCESAEYFKNRKDILTNPKVVIEVLSDSTAAWDRGGKFRNYGMLPSLKEYVLIEQNEALIEVFRKNEQGFWVLEWYAGLDAEIELQSLGIRIQASRIYHKVEFEG